MKLGSSRMVMAALVGMALANAPAFADELDIPIVNPVGVKPSSIRLQVQAGASGAQAGFTAQWMRKVDFDARGGWAAEGDPALMQGDFVGVPVWTTDGNAGDYTLAPAQWMDIELGQLFDESGVNASFVDELSPSTEYVVRVFSRAAGGASASQPTPDMVVATAAAAENCTYTIGYWKTHELAWPVFGLTLGSVPYTQAELLAILNEPAAGNGLLILAHQLIAAKLNILNGADPTFIAPMIASGDAQIGSLVCPPIGTDTLQPASVDATSHDLDDWNNGVTGPGHCGTVPAQQSTWGKIKSTYRH